MNSPIRQREVVVAEKLFRERGYIIYEADKDYRHEGTGEGLYDGDIGAIFMGYGWRADRQAGQRVADVTGKTVFALPLVADFIDDKFDGNAGGLRSKDAEGFHLDVLAQPLPTGHVICYWEGLPRPTQQLFNLFYGNLFDEDTRKFYSRLIKIGKDDYDKFAANSFALPNREAPNGYTLFIPEDISGELKYTLSGLGYRLFELDIEVARWSGGGKHCMYNVEYDFSAPTTRKLNYVEEFLVKEWVNNSDWHNEERRAVPGLRVFRPRQTATNNHNVVAKPA